MPELIRARDLMQSEFSEVRTDQTLGEAMLALREAQATANLPNALMIVDDTGKFIGMLTAKLLIRVLIGASELSEEGDDTELLLAARDRLPTLLGDAAIPDIPAVSPDDRLLTIIRRGLPTRLDFVPVVADGEPVGLVPVTAIFQSTASIALTPEHEGIRFDR